VALRALGEPDALPAGDLVLRRMAAPGMRLLSARELEERAHAWRPWRGYAVMHLWRAAATMVRQPTGERLAAARDTSAAQMGKMA
jgi:AraC family transcriptional regulator of adaptative response / DNA-3-methyladenine glycosylase II